MGLYFSKCARKPTLPFMIKLKNYDTYLEKFRLHHLQNVSLVRMSRYGEQNVIYCAVSNEIL